MAIFALFYAFITFVIDSRIVSGTITGKINVVVLSIQELDCVCTLKFSFFT